MNPAQLHVTYVGYHGPAIPCASYSSDVKSSHDSRSGLGVRLRLTHSRQDRLMENSPKVNDHLIPFGDKTDGKGRKHKISERIGRFIDEARSEKRRIDRMEFASGVGGMTA